MDMDAGRRGYGRSCGCRRGRERGWGVRLRVRARAHASAPVGGACTCPCACASAYMGAHACVRVHVCRCARMPVQSKDWTIVDIAELSAQVAPRSFTTVFLSVLKSHHDRCSHLIPHSTPFPLYHIHPTHPLLNPPHLATPLHPTPPAPPPTHPTPSHPITRAN